MLQKMELINDLGTEVSGPPPLLKHTPRNYKFQNRKLAALQASEHIFRGKGLLELLGEVAPLSERG